MSEEENKNPLKKEKVRNVGKIDRTLRGVLAVALIAAGIFFNNAALIIGVGLLFTVAFQWCPLYRIIGVSTCSDSCSSDAPGSDTNDGGES